VQHLQTEATLLTLTLYIIPLMTHLLEVVSPTEDEHRPDAPIPPVPTVPTTPPMSHYPEARKIGRSKAVEPGAAMQELRTPRASNQQTAMLTCLARIRPTISLIGHNLCMRTGLTRRNGLAPRVCLAVQIICLTKQIVGPLGKMELRLETASMCLISGNPANQLINCQGGKQRTG